LIIAYVRTRDGNDKAGGYGIQTAGSILIEKIEGSYDNVVGLPLRSLLKLIEKVMIPEEEETGGGMFVESDED
jgi:septum formation protein